ncbi:MAG: hypothetical protein H7Y00_01505 [Fimbriimonadaceae bacterium]|nr:hypothetical protein [Chitinophagales bacterium]
MRIFTLLGLLILFTISIQAQTVNTDVQEEHSEFLLNDHAQEKSLPLGGGLVFRTVKIYPNPVTHRTMHVSPVNLSVYGYQIYKTTGEIVEIDNLIGRDDFEIILLEGIELGSYYITFHTSHGDITHNFILLD